MLVLPAGAAGGMALTTTVAAVDEVLPLVVAVWLDDPVAPVVEDVDPEDDVEPEDEVEVVAPPVESSAKSGSAGKRRRTATLSPLHNLDRTVTVGTSRRQ